MSGTLCSTYFGPWQYAGEFLSLTVTNRSGNELQVVGKYGTDVQIDCTAPPIEPGSSVVVSRFPVGSDTQDHWDFIYLKDLGTGNYYQIYIEVTHGIPSLSTRRAYGFFGYYTDKHDNSKSNLCPFPVLSPNAQQQFPSCYSLVAYSSPAKGFEYILVATPPSPFPRCQFVPGPCKD